MSVATGPFLSRVAGAPRRTTKAGMVFYYPLDEASGNRFDAHVNALTLTDVSTVGSTTGVRGNAARFVVANNEALQRADEALISTGNVDWSLAFWFRVTNSGEHALVTKSNQGAGQVEYYAWANVPSAMNFRLTCSPDGTAQTTTAANSSNEIAINTWYFGACGHDAAADQIWCSINDRARTTTAYSSSGVFDSTAALELGRDAGAALTRLDGDLDEVGFWKRRLSESEVIYLYNGGGGRTYATV